MFASIIKISKFHCLNHYIDSFSRFTNNRALLLRCPISLSVIARSKVKSVLHSPPQKKNLIFCFKTLVGTLQLVSGQWRYIAPSPRQYQLFNGFDVVRTDELSDHCIENQHAVGDVILRHRPATRPTAETKHMRLLRFWPIPPIT